MQLMVELLVCPLIELNNSTWDATGIGATMTKYYGKPIAVGSPLELCYMLYKGQTNERFDILKANEEELNKIFIEIYGLQEELTPEVADRDITVSRIYDTKNEIPEEMKNNIYVKTCVALRGWIFGLCISLAKNKY